MNKMLFIVSFLFSMRLTAIELDDFDAITHQQVIFGLLESTCCMLSHPEFEEEDSSATFTESATSECKERDDFSNLCEDGTDGSLVVSKTPESKKRKRIYLNTESKPIDQSNESVKKRKFNLENRVFACEWEGCVFTTVHASSLKTHMKKHTGVREHHCTYCPYTAITGRALRKHIFTHTGEKPYKCTWTGCGFGTTDSDALKRHKYTHTGEKPYRCKICSYAGTSSSTLAVHMHTHTGEKRYACDQCDFRTATSSNLARHKRTHFRGKVYRCLYPGCNHVSKRSDYLIKHQRNKNHYTVQKM